MKKTILITAIAAAFLTGTALTSCESKEKKVDEAQTKVDEAKQDLKEAKKDEQKELSAEYPAYKTDAEARINANQKQIDDLRAKLSKSGGTRPLDPARQKRIDDLEKRNADLRARLYGYEKERSDWETFKREFNHDMDEIGNAFKDLGKDNVK
ncbi:MAG: hypothetical protein JWO03_3996 [Bacteroidetes bacterium]|nr:hypothetical protein [Bacteroidota bacterium]